MADLTVSHFLQGVNMLTENETINSSAQKGSIPPTPFLLKCIQHLHTHTTHVVVKEKKKHNANSRCWVMWNAQRL